MTAIIKERVRAEIDALAPWFHNLHLPSGIQTAPDHSLGDFPSYKWNVLASSLPQDLSGWRALDIGCNAGFYSLELAKRGAHVVGIDLDTHYLDQARWAVEQFKLQDRIEFRQMQIYDLARVDDSFDLVLFMGVFYHLRYPLLALDIVAQKVKRLLVFQSMMMPGKEVVEETDGFSLYDTELMHQRGWPKMGFIEHRLEGDPTNWWVPNHAGIEAMLRSSGLRVQERLRHELYLCEPDLDHPSSVTTWNQAELRSATGCGQSEEVSK
jgi:tRNA (mo5U34)-methyltransferase